MNAYLTMDQEEEAALGSANYDLVMSSSVNREENRKEEDDLDEEEK